MNETSKNNEELDFKPQILLKLLCLALDPAAQPGESESATSKFIALCRRESINYAQFRQFMVNGRPLPDRKKFEELEKIRMFYGKYIGLTLGEIYQMDRDYLTRIIVAHRRASPMAVKSVKAFLKEAAKLRR